MRHAPCIALLLVLGLSPVILAETEAPQPTITELQAEIARLKARLAEVEAENARLKGEVVDLETTQEDLVVEKQQLEKLAGVTTSGERVASMDAVIQTRYNELTDRTSALTRPRRVDIGAVLFEVPHYLAFAYDHPGQTPTEPLAHVRLLIYTQANNNQRYGLVDTASLTIDDETVELPVTDYKILKTNRMGASVAGAESYNEKVTIEVDAATLDRLANASQVRMKLNATKFAWDQDTIALAGAVAARLQLEN